jgi:tRNA A-37 threonylcarbamoyl transferase component Bud32
LPVSAEDIRLVELAGGVSSGIWRCVIDGKQYCIKQALQKLKVEQDWFASTERNNYEWKWLKFVSQVNPHLVPELVGRDDAAGLIVMSYLSPESFSNWKAQLMLGETKPAVSANIGRWLASIHAHSIESEELSTAFPANPLFDELRIDPYFRSLIPLYPEIETQLTAIIDALLSSRTTLIHGDVSPKNILIRDEQPVFLDAECACLGDPAFDLAFCLNHLLLKTVYKPEFEDQYMACYSALAKAYVENITWESNAELHARTAKILPALMLARIDGKSPVEYLTLETDKSHVREFAINTLKQPIPSIIEFGETWLNSRKIV